MADDAPAPTAPFSATSTMGKLFLHEGGERAALHAVKMRWWYFTQAAVQDGCRRAVKAIEEFVLENARGSATP